MVTTLVNQVGTGAPVVVTRSVLMQRLLPVALVYWVPRPIAVQVLLARD